MQITTNGIVIREKMLNNDDRLLTILTDQYGVVHAFTKAIRKLGSSLAASTELFSYSTFVLFHNKERYSVNSADSNKIFFKIRLDLEKLSLASYMAELSTALAPEKEDATAFLRLILNSLHMLEDDLRTVNFMKPVFELRILTLAGYMPDLVACHNCGEFSGSQFYFFPRTGFLLCPDCVESYEKETKILITLDQLSAMRHIIYSEFKNLFQFKMSPEGLSNLNKVTEWYVYAQLERALPSLEFYKSVCPNK